MAFSMKAPESDSGNKTISAVIAPVQVFLEKEQLPERIPVETEREEFVVNFRRPRCETAAFLFQQGNPFQYILERRRI
jgi:hypothetical protein